MGTLPITVGVDVMTAYGGTTTSVIAVQAGDRRVLADLTRRDNGYFFDLVLRVQPVRWWVWPYLEGLVGAKVLQTNESLSFHSGEASTSFTSEHDWAGSIGWGAGLDVGIARDREMNFTIGLRRQSGSKASFSHAARIDGGDVVRYDVSTSSTLYMVGVTSCFGGDRILADG